MKEIILPTNETLVIRIAQKGDAEAMLQYLKIVGNETDFLTFSGDEIKRSQSEQEKIIADHKNVENKIFLIAEINHQVVGLSNVSSRSRERLKHVGEFGVSTLKAHWGKGIATHLITVMIAWAKANPIIKKLNLLVLVHNESAIRLYKKLGFEIEGCLRSDFYIKGKFYDTYFMGMFID